MSVQDLKDALRDIPGIEGLTITYAPNGNQVLTVGAKSVEVGPMASNDEIRLALQNPTIRTENTKVRMSPLQGVGQKLSKLKHAAEFDAQKLASRIDALESRKDAAVQKSNTLLDGHERDVADIETFVTEMEQATNQ